jgi:low affinity Fe/Cu permease
MAANGASGMLAWFPAASRRIASFAGRGSTFIVAVVLVVAWLVTGPLFDYSDTWQLVINTATTIVTFLMVFLIQNTQNRDTEALQIKLDEIIRATQGTHNSLLDLEELDEDALEAHRRQYVQLAKRARERLRRGIPDEDCPELEAADGGMPTCKG